MVKIIPYSGAYLKSYQDFARRGWGKNCYQQTEKYLNWLYQKNPYADKEKPFWLVIEPQNNMVIGVMHKMCLPWVIDEQKVLVSSIHNLLVDKDYRRGSGLMLITAALKDAAHAFCPGVWPPLSDAYKMLRCQEIDALWFRKIISPVGAVVQKIFKLALPPRKKNIRAQILTEPSAVQIAAMVKTLNVKSGGHVLWDVKIFNWRFLQGPKHVFLWEDAANFLILSAGQRKGLTVARIIDGHIENENSSLWRDTLSAARSLRAVVLLGYTADRNLQKYFLTKIKPNAKHPLVFFYHKDKKKREMNFNAAAGDFGLESFLNN
ncbi:MAG: hypothetical protein LBL50_01020 [Candidatus Margulisbacteria bacterium]|jgi:hypothetical protein|nr:hypothetical protein [Candidatus Margulisiibacteriota bacterium]